LSCKTAHFLSGPAWTRTRDLFLISYALALFRPVYWVQRVHQTRLSMPKRYVPLSSSRHRSMLRPARLQYGCSKSDTGEAFGETANGYKRPKQALCAVFDHSHAHPRQRLQHPSWRRTSGRCSGRRGRGRGFRGRTPPREEQKGDREHFIAKTLQRGEAQFRQEKLTLSPTTSEGRSGPGTYQRTPGR
jgi:hypothetical protein